MMKILLSFVFLFVFSCEGAFAIPESDIKGTHLILMDMGSANKISIKTPTLSAPYALTLPVDDGTPNQVLKTDGSGILSWATITSGVTSVTASAPLASSGGATPDISIPKATTSVDGYLAATDFTTFNNKQAAGNYITALTGDGTASGPGSAAFTLATVNGNVGSFGSSTAIPSFTVNGKGLITAASTNAVVAPAGTLTGTTLASNVVSSSLTSVGTITSGVWNGTLIDITRGGTNSSAALNNNRIIQSSGGAIVEAPAITANKALASNSSGIPVATTTTDTQLGYLSDVTSNIQNQFSYKGNVNYITNNGAEVDTSGWATYKDTAGATPVDATGGSPTETLTRSTSSPLRGSGSFLLTKDAANRQGEGFSYDFTIDSADQTKLLTISFDWSVASGTYSAGTSTTDSDLVVYIYDVTNGAVIQPAPYKLDGAVVGTQYAFRGEFQANSTSTSYRLVVHTATTSASAYTVKFDNVVVGPVKREQGTIVTAWTAYTPTFTGFGAVTVQNFIWRRNGDNLEVQGKFTAVAITAVEKQISFPSGFTSVSTLPTISHAGWYTRGGSAVAAKGGPVLREASKTYFTFSSPNLISGTNTDPDAKDASSGNFGSGDLITMTAQVPIAGASSNVLLSSETTSRPVAIQVHASTTAATTSAPFIFTTVDSDPWGAYSTSTGKFTAPVAGYYQVNWSMQITANTTFFGVAYINGSANTVLGLANGTNAAGNGSGVVKLNAGDTFELRPSASVTAVNTNGANYLSIIKMGDPSIVAATDPVVARYFSSATSISGSLATINWTTKDFDTHSGMSSGVYTVPARGKYQVNASLALSGTFVLNNTTSMELQKNNTAVATSTNFIAAAITNDRVSISDVVDCNVGDTIRIQVSNSGTAPAIVSSSVKNFISIIRVGL